MRALGYQLVDKLVSHLSTLREQPVARRGTFADFSSLVDESLPELPGDHADCLKFFSDLNSFISVIHTNTNAVQTIPKISR